MKEFVCLFEIECLDLENKVQTEYGLIYADNFRDAMEQLEGSMYGNELIKINSMELFDCSAIFSKEVFALVRKEIEQGVQL